MTRTAVAALVAAVLTWTATPAGAQPLHPGHGRVAPVTACARIVMAAAGEAGDCAVHVCKPHRHKRHHRHHVGRKHHRHHRYGCVTYPGAVHR